MKSALLFPSFKPYSDFKAFIPTKLEEVKKHPFFMLHPVLRNVHVFHECSRIRGMTVQDVGLHCTNVALYNALLLKKIFNYI